MSIQSKNIRIMQLKIHTSKYNNTMNTYTYFHQNAWNEYTSTCNKLKALLFQKSLPYTVYGTVQHTDLTTISLFLAHSGSSSIITGHTERLQLNDCTFRKPFSLLYSYMNRHQLWTHWINNLYVYSICILMQLMRLPEPESIKYGSNCMLV